jgi:hypothetical protein
MLDYDFNMLGQWIGVFFENDVKVTSSIFHIVPKVTERLPYEGETMKCETCRYFTMVFGKDYGICALAVKRRSGNPYRRPLDTSPGYEDRNTG